MIFITGDTHGENDFEKLLKLKKLNLTFDDHLIICGDVAICWEPVYLKYMVDLYSSIGCTILFIDGNHENFDMLESKPLIEYKGALMHKIGEHIFHILRGEIMTLEGKTFLCIGGGYSIDKALRLPYLSWWPQEEITYHDVDNAIENLSKYDNKVDYVLTHCCDTKTVIKAFGFRRDSSTDQLNFIDKIVDYKHWYFGHYHFDREISPKKTVLYQKIFNLETGEEVI